MDYRLVNPGSWRSVIGSVAILVGVVILLHGMTSIPFSRGDTTTVTMLDGEPPDRPSVVGERRRPYPGTFGSVLVTLGLSSVFLVVGGRVLITTPKASSHRPG